ncbi:hypothetical protein WJX77_011516 [Trebouxia sp. C0004]
MKHIQATSSKEKVAYLSKLAEALPGKLTLFAADLTSFDSIGVDYVFHTASPFIINVTDPRQHQACSPDFFLCIHCEAQGGSKGQSEHRGRLEHRSRRKCTGCRCLPVQQVAAEREAWEISKKHNFELVTIYPTFVLGPVISNWADATSILEVKGLIEGTNDSVTPWVCDVQDIARAHILAAEVPSGICKVQKELGFSTHPWQEIIVDMATTLIQRGICIAKPVSK